MGRFTERTSISGFVGYFHGLLTVSKQVGCLATWCARLRPVMLWQVIPKAIQVAKDGHVSIIDSEWFRSLALAAIGLLGTMTPVLVGWLRDRDATAERTRQFDQASKAVAFWKAWYEAIAPMDSGSDAQFWRERARSQMWLASCAVEDLIKPRAGLRQSSPENPFFAVRRKFPWWKRWMLAYKPPRLRAWIPRAVFYSYVFLGPFFIVSTIKGRIADLNGEVESAKESSATSLFDSTSSIYVQTYLEKAWRIEDAQSKRDQYIEVIPWRIGQYTMFCVICALAFRWLSLWLELPKLPAPSIEGKTREATSP